MKSPMIVDAGYIDDKSNYSDLCVMQSNAGYYIGTYYNNPDGFVEPGSRDSNYFGTKEEAEEFLKLVESGENEAIDNLRMNP